MKSVHVTQVHEHQIDDDIDIAISEARGGPATRTAIHTDCGPWMAGTPSPLSGRIKYGVCTKHGGRSRTAEVFLARERCDVARRALPTAKRRGK